MSDEEDIYADLDDECNEPGQQGKFFLRHLHSMTMVKSLLTVIVSLSNRNGGHGHVERYSRT